MNIVQIMNAAFAALVLSELGASHDYKLELWDEFNSEDIAECQQWIADIIAGDELGISFSRSAYSVVPCLR